MSDFKYLNFRNEERGIFANGPLIERARELFLHKERHEKCILIFIIYTRK